eukprot:1922712-Ditylum_brightwellii.AAC.1
MGNTDTELKVFCMLFIKYNRNRKIVDEIERNLLECLLPPSQLNFVTTVNDPKSLDMKNRMIYIQSNSLKKEQDHCYKAELQE